MTCQGISWGEGCRACLPRPTSRSEGGGPAGIFKARLVWRWCFYELNLFGDPELPMWGAKSLALTVVHPSSIPIGPQNYTLTVRSSGQPLANALACLWKGDEVYARAHTDASGNAVLSICPTTNGVMLVTVTAKDHLPYENISDVNIEEGGGSVHPAAPYVGVVNTFSTRRIKVAYQTARAQMLSVSLYDAAGRKVGPQLAATVAGQGSLFVPIGDLAFGVYHLRVESGGRLGLCSRIVIVR